MRIEKTIVQDRHGFDLHVNIYRPDAVPDAVIQVVHGLGEHAGRYREFASQLCDAGYLVVIHDQHGHGKSALYDDRIHLADADGEALLIEGVRVVRERVRSEYPQLSIVAIGHSMGAFVLRALMFEHKDLYDGVVLIGSGYVPKHRLVIAKRLASWIRRMKGPQHQSPFFTRFMQDRAVRSMHKAGLIEERHEWITSDTHKQREYLDDPMTKRIPTIATQLALVNLLRRAHDGQGARINRSDHLVALLCGDQDALCDYGDALKRLYRFFQQAGFTNARFRVYPNARHEILNERERESIFRDIFTLVRAAAKP